jgi:hypothetical protein
MNQQTGESSNGTMPYRTFPNAGTDPFRPPSNPPSEDEADGNGVNHQPREYPDTNELWGRRGLEYLNIIDRLRSHERSTTSDIPQLVVCGNTSAGKSSVLEALTNINFPKSGKMCTSFVTELVLQLKFWVHAANLLVEFKFAKGRSNNSVDTSFQPMTNQSLERHN